MFFGGILLVWQTANGLVLRALLTVVFVWNCIGYVILFAESSCWPCVIVEWLKLEGILKPTHSRTPAVSWLLHQLRLPSVPSRLALSTSRDGASAAFLGSLCQ